MHSIFPVSAWATHCLSSDPKAEIFEQRVAVVEGGKRSSSNQKVGGSIPVFPICMPKCPEAQIATHRKKGLPIDGLYECIYEWVNGKTTTAL